MPHACGAANGLGVSQLSARLPLTPHFHHRGRPAGTNQPPVNFAGTLADLPPIPLAALSFAFIRVHPAFICGAFALALLSIGFVL
jgi:hypothetical protein